MKQWWLRSWPVMGHKGQSGSYRASIKETNPEAQLALGWDHRPQSLPGPTLQPWSMSASSRVAPCAHTRARLYMHTHTHSSPEDRNPWNKHIRVNRKDGEPHGHQGVCVASLLGPLLPAGLPPSLPLSPCFPG